MGTWICDWTWRQGICPARAVEREGFGMVWLKAGGAEIGDFENGRRERFVDPTFFASYRAVRDTELIPGAYWYLVPERPYAQAGMFLDLLRETGAPGQIVAKLDVEHTGLRWKHVYDFCKAWQQLTVNPLVIYTNANAWSRLGAAPGAGGLLTPWLEVASWVPAEIRNNPEKPYASQQLNATAPSWRRERLDGRWGGWPMGWALQFTDNALIAGNRQMASWTEMPKQAIRAAFLR